MDIYQEVLHPPVVERGADYNSVCMALEALIGKNAIFGRVLDTPEGEEDYFKAK